MGLLATGHAMAALTEPHEFDAEACYEAGHERAYVGDVAFARALGGLPLGRCYATSGITAHADNNYGGYSTFRERLSRMALGVSPEAVWRDPNAYVGRPFFPLVHFSDCEGTIGPVPAYSLAANFIAWRDRWHEVVAPDDPNGFDRARYDSWTRVFLTAAFAGMVVFA